MNNQPPLSFVLPMPELDSRLLDYQLSHYTERLKAARETPDNWKQVAFLRKRLHELKLQQRSLLN